MQHDGLRSARVSAAMGGNARLAMACALLLTSLALLPRATVADVAPAACGVDIPDDDFVYVESRDMFYTTRRRRYNAEPDMVLNGVEYFEVDGRAGRPDVLLRSECGGDGSGSVDDTP